MAKAELNKVRAARGKAAAARFQLEQTIREAAKAGHTLREIADAAGVSYETVRRINGNASM